MGLTQKILIFTSVLVVALVATSLVFTTVQADRLAKEDIARGLGETRQVWETFQADRYNKLKLGIRVLGNDPDTGVYASSLLGSTTVLSRTEVDAPGTQNDAERVSESRRDLRQAPELRLIVFIFLVALGSDYNIFLMSRAREEAQQHGTREGMLRAVVPCPV